MKHELLDKLEQIKAYAASIEIEMQDRAWDDANPEDSGSFSVEDECAYLDVGDTKTLQLGFLLKKMIVVEHVDLDGENSELKVIGIKE